MAAPPLARTLTWGNVRVRMVDNSVEVKERSKDGDEEEFLMDLEEVSKLCASLNLEDDDGPVVELSPAICSDDKGRLESCL
ncbi:hypothetical protein PanWU01x14_119320, partial [Parasponia andersonii]